MPDLPTNNPEQFFQGAPLLTVPDVPATTTYYHDMLGFRSDPEAISDRYGVVWRDNAAIHFSQGEQRPSGVRIFFWVRDVNRLYDEIRGQGAEVITPIGTREYHVRDFSIRDLNGVEIIFGQDWD